LKRVVDFRKIEIYHSIQELPFDATNTKWSIEMLKYNSPLMEGDYILIFFEMFF
jgi:hypothetical protein